MSKCDHTWVMDDSPRPACHKCFMERDACAMSDRIATLERELAAVTAERDALLAGKWAGPWDSLTHFAWVRRDSRGSAVTPVRLTHERAACDAALAKKGWYLAPTPPTGTPGDGTR